MNETTIGARLCFGSRTRVTRLLGALRLHVRRLHVQSSWIAIFLCLACAVYGWGRAPGSKPRATFDEYFNSVDIPSVELSPDGHMVAIATERADWEAQRYRKDLWLWRDSDNALIPLTQSGHDWSPEWSPDGKWVAFLSDRRTESENPDESSDEKKDVTHLYVIPIAGGEAFAVTRGEEEVHTFAWAPDSKSLYFATRSPLPKKQREEEKADWKDTIRYREQERGDVISRIAVADALARRTPKAGSGPKETARHSAKNHDSTNHDSKDDDDEETGETPGAQAIVSSAYRVKSMAISPDGGRVAFATDSVSERFEGLKAIEIYVANTAVTGAQNKATQLTNNQAVEEDLRWSPDGKRIYFDVSQGSVEGAYTDVQPRLYSIDSVTGQPTRWAAQFEGAVVDFTLEPDGSLVTSGMLGTSVGLYRQQSPADPFRKLDGRAGFYEHATTAKGSPRIAFTYSAIDKPTEAYIAESADTLGAAKAITSFNQLFTQRDMPQGKPYQWTRRMTERRLRAC